MSHFARRFGFVTLLPALAILAALAPRARADDAQPPGLIPVGTTYDWCREATFVRFQVHDGEAHVKKGETRHFKLSGKKTELYWYCGDTRERCANDKPFNWVRLFRSPDGRMTWTFFNHD